MYKKKSRIPLIATIVAAIMLLIGIIGAGYLTRRPEPEPETVKETESEQSSHEILIHKSNAAKVTFDADFFKEEKEDDTILIVPDLTLVSLTIEPMEGKYLNKVNLYEAGSVNTQVGNVINKRDGGKYNMDFTMPERDIVLSMEFADAEISTAWTAETETEEMTEEASPYGLTLHGVTADVITSYNGQFDDRDFLQQLGDALHIDSARSEYHDVTDVWISTEEYEGIKDADKVYYYIYFNEDQDRKLLSTYYLKEKSYVFSKPAARESENENGTTGGNTNGAGNTGAGSYTPGSTASTSGTAGNSGGTTVVSEVSLDIMTVSTVFMDYTGGEKKSTFYEEIFHYVADTKKMTGKLVGTFVSYKIDPENSTVSFEVSLNTGGTIKGTYKKADNTYSFSGL